MPVMARQTLIPSGECCLLCQKGFDPKAAYGGPVFLAEELNTGDINRIENLLNWYKTNETPIFDRLEPVACVDTNGGTGFIHWNCFDSHILQLRQILEG